MIDVRKYMLTVTKHLVTMRQALRYLFVFVLSLYYGNLKCGNMRGP
jgi:hypothetical protein